MNLPRAAGFFFSSPVHPLRADNKFSSFVRQLNFYGFRKVKSNITVEGHDTKWWEFKVRGSLVSTRMIHMHVKRVLLFFVLSFSDLTEFEVNTASVCTSLRQQR